MKKVIVLLSMIVLFTGCNVIKIDDQNVDTIIDTVLKEKNERYNTVFEGYKYYLPKGTKLLEKTDYNATLSYQNHKYYLYVDVISYYHKTNDNYKKNNKVYYSKPLNYQNKKGYLEINEIQDRYFVEMMYNYAKMEAYVPKTELRDTLVNMSYILSSVKFNDQVLSTLVGENVLNYKEETFSILKPKRETGSFLDYVKEYDVYYDKNNELPDEDKIQTEEEE